MLAWLKKHKALVIALILALVVLVAVISIDWVQVEIDSRVQVCEGQCAGFEGDEWIECMGACVSEERD